MLLLDTRGPWLLIQTSSPVHVPVLVLAKLLATSFEDEKDQAENPWRGSLVAEIVGALSLRGTQDNFDRVSSNMTGETENRMAKDVLMCVRVLFDTQVSGSIDVGSCVKQIPVQIISVTLSVY